MAQESMEITSESDCEVFSEDSEDEYNLQVTVAVTEIERRNRGRVYRCVE